MQNTQTALVAAVVPFAEDGGDEVLVLDNDGLIALPIGELNPGERVLDAAARIVSESTGLRVAPLRVLYLLENADGSMIFGVLCAPSDDSGDEANLRGDVVSLSRIERDFLPMALLEILVEDLRSGFIRPVAHVIESSGPDGRNVHVTW